MKRFRFFFGFLRALWYAARHDLAHLGLKLTLSNAKAMFSDLTGFLFKKDNRATREVFRDRLLHGCSRCPIYCEELGTCGDARQLDDKDPLGCFCFLEIKARIKGAVCWLHEPEQQATLKDMRKQGMKYGWPEAVTP